MNDISMLVLQIILGAVCVTLVGILVMTGLFGIAMATVMKNKKGIFGLLLVGATLPVLMGGMTGQLQFVSKASERILISNVEWEKADTGWIVSFDSSKAALIYLEWKDGNKVWPIIPTSNPVADVKHVYWISDEMMGTGEMWIVTQNSRQRLIKK